MKQGWIQVTSDNVQEPMAPKTMADMVYMDSQQSETVKSAMLARAPLHYAADLPANGWGTAVPYTQTVQVAGILETDIPLVDVTLSDVPDTRISQSKAFGYVSMVTTADGSITAICDEGKPGADLTLMLKVVR